MKKLLLIAFAAIMFILSSTTAYADSIKVESQIYQASPDPKTMGFSQSFGIRGAREMIFEVAGKTCTLLGSATNNVQGGCNYVLTVAPDGSISGTGNSGCTTDVAPDCSADDSDD